MIVYLLTEAIELLFALGKISYSGIIWLYKWYFNSSEEIQKDIEMKTLEERVEMLESLIKENKENTIDINNDREITKIITNTE